jgi:hypothetical protein
MQYDDAIVEKKFDNATESESSGDDPDLRRKIINLSTDIVRGQVQPVVRKIKAAKYELDIDGIRQVLMNLYLAGLIEKDARNSYKLHVVT